MIKDYVQSIKKKQIIVVDVRGFSLSAWEIYKFLLPSSNYSKLIVDIDQADKWLNTAVSAEKLAPQ